MISNASYAPAQAGSLSLVDNKLIVFSGTTVRRAGPVASRCTSNTLPLCAQFPLGCRTVFCYLNRPMVQTFDGDTRLWTHRYLQGPMPPPAVDSAKVLLSDDVLLVFGGAVITSNSTSACYFTGETWLVGLVVPRQINLTLPAGPSYPSARFGAAITVHKGIAYMLGGCQVLQRCLPYSYCYNVLPEVRTERPHREIGGFPNRFLDARSCGFSPRRPPSTAGYGNC